MLAPPSLDSLRQQMEFVQLGLTLVQEYVHHIQDLDRRGVPLDAATVAAEVDRLTRPLWQENSAICAAMNAHVAARYGKGGIAPKEGNDT